MTTSPTAWADPAGTWSSASAAWAYPGVTSLDAKFEWSPSTAPGAAPSWEDITDRVRSGSISRGRQSEFDQTAAGRLRLELDNRDREFDPEVNTNAKPNKRIRVSVGATPDTVYLFDGFVDALPQMYDPPNDATVTLTATDGFKILSRFELDEIYGPVVDADGPWGWWRCADDLPRATTVADSSGNGFHGTWNGTPRSSSSLITDGPGAVSLDGSSVDAGTGGDHIAADGAVIDAGTGVTLAAAPLSVECWVRTGKWGTNLSFICGQTHVVGSTFLFDFGLVMDNATGLPQFLAKVGGINTSVTGSTVLRDTGVHHLVGTVDSSRNLRLYVDGVLQGDPSAAGTTTAVDSSGAFRIGKPPVPGEPAGQGSAYRPFKGDICEVAVYDRALSGAEILEHYTSGAAPWANDSTGARVARVLSLAGWPTGSSYRTLDVGASTLGAAQNIEGKSALEHILAVERTEQGRFFMTGAGKAAFFSRNHETSLTVKAAFDEADYTDLMFDFSEANLVNDCTVTRELGLPQRAQNATSISAYWRMSENMTGLLYSSDNEALAMAQWAVATRGEPVLRPSQLTFVPVADLPDLFPRVLSRELGDRIEITRQLDGTDIVVDAVIEGIEHTFTPRMWETSFNLAPMQSGQFGPGGGSSVTFLKLNDTTLGRLDNNNRLGF